MKTYKYKAINNSGEAVSGLVEAASETDVVEALKEKDYRIIGIERKRKNFKINHLPGFLERISRKDVVMFARQFSVLISASVAPVQSLRLLVEQTVNHKMRRIVSDVANKVNGGTRISEAMARHPKVFSNFFVSVIKSGESSGKLDEVLNYLADELEKDYDMMSKIRGAMIYPIFVLCGLGGVGAMMMIFVIPKLTDIIAESGAQLPLATRILMHVSDFLSAYWWLLIILFAGLGIGARLFYKTRRGKRCIDTALLHTPIFGKLFQRIFLVRLLRSFETLIVGGVSVVKALDISAEVVGNAVYKELIRKTRKEVEDGNSIFSTFEQSKDVPVMVSQMIRVGEKTGRLDSVLQKISNFYSREINNIIANLMTLMEPIIMVTMGVAVGIMVAAVIMPMYNMAAVM